MTNSALAGVVVLDLSRILAGPYCTMQLADYGAEVIKIEQPGSGDPTRQWGPPWLGDESAYFLCANRNKKSVTLDLKNPAGLELLLRLVDSADVLIENFKPGTAERLGLGYAALAERNPRLIYCSISGYGQTGPYRERPGYDFIIQAQGGLMSITGQEEGGPSKAGVAIVDITAGLFATNAVLAALHSRGQTGRGQHIDVALLDAQLGWLANVAQGYLVTDEPPARHGNAHPNIVPYETFPTADGEIAVGVGSNPQFQRLCQLTGRPELASDERFATNEGRVTHRKELISILNDLFSTQPSHHWLDALLGEGIPASPINDIPTILADPQVAARNMVQDIEHPSAGSLRLIGPVAKLSETPARIRSAPPELGADTEEVLAERLGLSGKEIEGLRAQGIL